MKFDSVVVRCILITMAKHILFKNMFGSKKFSHLFDFVLSILKCLYLNGWKFYNRMKGQHIFTFFLLCSVLIFFFMLNFLASLHLTCVLYPNKH